jgi:YVTN family beta-propeller protein
VADWYAKRLFAVDPALGQVVGEAPVGTSPSGIAVTPDGRLILTSDRDDNAVSITDAQTLERIGTLAVGERPFGITIDPEGSRAYTANVGSDDVTVIDIAARRVVGTVKVGQRPYAVAIAGNLAFVTDQYSGTVSAFDRRTLEAVARIPVGEHPEGIGASRNGRFVYVANWFSDTLSVIDVGSLKVIATIPVGEGPRAFGSFIR